MAKSLAKKSHSNLSFLLLFILNFVPIIANYFLLIGSNKLYYVSIFSIIFIIYYNILVHIKHKNYKVDKKWFILFTITLFICLTGYVLNKHLINYLYLLFVLGVYYIFKLKDINKETLLRVSNFTFLIYLLLSFLVYFNVIHLIKLNQFYYRIMGYSFQTFIGFYGSTAHLDTYSCFILIINVLFNKKSNKSFYIIISFFSFLGTLTLTPYLSVLLALLCTILVKFLKKNSISLLNILFFFSFSIPIFIVQITKMSSLETVFSSFTSARYYIWRDMLNIYYKSSLPRFLVGYEDTSHFSVHPFGDFNSIWGYQLIYTQNPHNSFLLILIEYGLVIFLFFFLFVTKSMKTLSRKDLFVCYFLLSSSITNSQIFDFHFPIFLIWIIALFRDNSSERPKTNNVLINLSNEL